jgi:ketosteroid isomerase-like protein
MMPDKEGLIRSAYAAFNARDVDGVLALLEPDIDWENGMEGGRVHGHEGVRDYWVRQWRLIDPRVEPQSIQLDDDGRVVVEVHQVVRDLAGTLLADQTVYHAFEFKGGLIKRMDINP